MAVNEYPASYWQHPDLKYNNLEWQAFDDVIGHPNGATHDRLIGPPYDRPNGASFKWPF